MRHASRCDTVRGTAAKCLENLFMCTASKTSKHSLNGDLTDTASSQHLVSCVSAVCIGASAPVKSHLGVCHWVVALRGVAGVVDTSNIQLQQAASAQECNTCRVEHINAVVAAQDALGQGGQVEALHRCKGAARSRW